MDIDKLFKVRACLALFRVCCDVYALQVPRLPTSSKRKMPDNPTPEMLKKMRLDASSNGDSKGSATDIDMPESSSALRRQSQRATVEDGDDTMVDTLFAPGNDADYFVEEDEEGRFYGGGLTSEQKQILSIFESAEGEGTTEDVSAYKISRNA